LQADCFSGVWAHHANRSRQILEEGDIEEALNAASAIGDDRLQQRGKGIRHPGFFYPRKLQAARTLVQARLQDR
jgi:predicted metalloprotease